MNHTILSRQFDGERHDERSQAFLRQITRLICLSTLSPRCYVLAMVAEDDGCVLPHLLLFCLALLSFFRQRWDDTGKIVALSCRVSLTGDKKCYVWLGWRRAQEFFVLKYSSPGMVNPTRFSLEFHY